MVPNFLSCLGGLSGVETKVLIFPNSVLVRISPPCGLDTLGAISGMESLALAMRLVVLLRGDHLVVE